MLTQKTVGHFDIVPQFYTKRDLLFRSTKCKPNGCLNGRLDMPFNPFTTGLPTLTSKIVWR